ncbi:hypothetical protein CKM354_001216500 [Cercospora kikuchii]|uniref:Ankyrin n=1 Tax=Cercospora kikuchii TaxID=84275 RepID=A0A9P3FLG3_9PEZI|nr:uncharacterized protein CKM354_001216500 [Cercospora kikuchii]GIZ49128.1 hypothetical protein CKM354_001216500 [Cercospora kikuchii]
MPTLLDCPSEILDAIVEGLVVIIGIQNAVCLRTVCRAFDSAILHAICVSQVVSIYDKATPHLENRMNPKLRGKIYLRQSQTLAKTGIISDMNSKLDDLLDDVDTDRRGSRHEAVACAVQLKHNVEKGENVEAQNLLSGAIISGELELTRQLLEGRSKMPFKAEVDGVTPYFQSPVHLAAAGGHFEILKLLLAYGAQAYNPSATTLEWDRKSRYPLRLFGVPPTPLRLAICHGHTEIVHLLLQPQNRPPDTSIEYSRCILAAGEAGRIDLIDELCKVMGRHWTEFNGLGRELMMVAVQHIRKEVVSMILDSGIPANLAIHRARGDCPSILYLAAYRGHTALVQYLLDRGASLTFNPKGARWDWCPIEGAAEGGHRGLVEMLIDKGADSTPSLRSAAKGGHAGLVAHLLGRFPDLPGRGDGDNGQQAMHVALQLGNITVIKLLVEAGVRWDDGTLFFNCRPWPSFLAPHLRKLGAHDLGTRQCSEWNKNVSKGVCISERTWQWV